MNTLTTERQYASIKDWDKKSYHGKTFWFVYNQPNPSKTMAEVNKTTNEPIRYLQYPKSVSIELIDEIFWKDPSDKSGNKGRMRVIRYSPGESSIFKDEQSDDRDNPKQKQRIEFIDGCLYVDSRETQKLEFIMNCNFNGSNINRDKNKKPWFYIVDSEKGYENFVTDKSAIISAQQWCLNPETPFDEIKAYARVLNLNVNADSNEIRFNLSKLAEKNPAKFLEGLKSDVTKRKHWFLEAQERGIITTNNGVINWTGGGTICVVPVGKDPIDELVDRSMQDGAGQTVYYRIKELLKAKPYEADQGEKILSSITENESVIEEVPVQQFTPEPEKIVVPKADEPSLVDGDSVETILFNAAKTKGVLIIKTSWVTYGKIKMQKKDFLQWLKQNPQEREKLQQLVG